MYVCIYIYRERERGRGGEEGERESSLLKLCSRRGQSIYPFHEYCTFDSWFDLVWLYGTSTIISYLMPNQCFYIKTVLFETIQFCISTKFIWQNSSISNNLI